jgi:hypothetical protein
MADLSWNYELKPGERANPVVHYEYVNMDGVFYPSDEDLLRVFKTDGFKLQTWGRTVDKHGKVVREMDPHWIAVRKGTPLHNDKAYPRYTHHLKVRVDEGIYARGLDKTEIKLERGLFYILDTHSPHQVFHKGREGVWNVSCSVDSKEPLEPSVAIKMCLDYIATRPFIPEWNPVTGFNVQR